MKKLLLLICTFAHLQICTFAQITFEKTFGSGTNAAPSGLGIAAKNSLIAKGWTVITN